MKSLRRIVVGDFKIEEAITLDDLEKNKENVNIISINEIFKNLKNITLNERKQELFLNGVQLTFDLPNGIYNIYSENKTYIGLGTIKNKLLKRDIII